MAYIAIFITILFFSTIEVAAKSIAGNIDNVIKLRKILEQSI